MKVTTPCGKYWVEQTEEETKFGFTPDYIVQLGAIWVFSPKNLKAVVAEKPFANVESVKFLGPLRSPVSGKVLAWNEKVLKHPESITNEDFLLSVKENK